MLLHCCLISYTGKMFLGLNLVLLHVNYLPLQLEQSEAVKVSENRHAVIERSNQCNFNYFFFFLMTKRKVIEGILTVRRKKKIEIVRDLGDESSHEKNVNCVQSPNLVTKEKGSHCARRMTSLQCNALITFIKTTN